MTITTPPAATPSKPVAAITADSYRAQRLTKAAHEFEGMMLTELLKPLGKTEDEAAQGSESTGSNPLQTFGIQAVAGALANSGALGFAREIEQALARTHQVPPTVAANTHSSADGLTAWAAGPGKRDPPNQNAEGATQKSRTEP